MDIFVLGLKGLLILTSLVGLTFIVERGIAFVSEVLAAKEQ